MSAAFRFARIAALCATALTPLSFASAGPVEIIAVRAFKTSEREGLGVWRFEVTLKHADEGWEHYADAWQIRTPDGAPLGTRTLFHPHVDEQPFTRALADVEIPAEIDILHIFAHDKLHGETETPVELTLPRVN